ncbi:hypothetical protein TNCT_555311 [Trichonephila clavata]|uniref:Uncharacterized protein n=1 Tax=Trichonephila clavata TaxID=2740835 RepID=A0A8X6EWC5_TRICU|nr:hypothetical protein TNCT_555311 [Trichonephila clavata]
MMIQKIWLLKIDWDQNLPRQEIENFQRYVAELHQLKDLKIPRCILLKDFCCSFNLLDLQMHQPKLMVHAYKKSENANETQIDYSAAKLASPLKTLSIPRLELLAATLFRN